MMGRRSPEKEAYWRKLLRQQEKSGQSVLHFCKQHGLSEASFHHWKREIGRRDQQTSGTTKSREKVLRNRRKKNTPRDSSTSLFIPLQLTSAAASPIELVHPRGHVLRIPAVFDEGCLQQVLQLLDRDQEV